MIQQKQFNLADMYDLILVAFLKKKCSTSGHNGLCHINTVICKHVHPPPRVLTGSSCESSISAEERPDMSAHTAYLVDWEGVSGPCFTKPQEQKHTAGTK